MKKFIPRLAAALFFFAATDARAQGPAQITRLDPALDRLVSQQATLDTLATGMRWAEGPLWLPATKTLIWSDVKRNIIFCWTASAGKREYLKPSGLTGSNKRGGEMGSNGLALARDGSLLLCQDGDRHIARMIPATGAPAPRYRTISAGYRGKKFNSPNDMAIASNGDIYFTDPPYGLEHGMEDPLKEMPYQGVFRTDTKGNTVLLVDSIARPNGIAIFPDGKSILIGNSDGDKPYIYRYDLDEKGLLHNGRIFFDAGKYASYGPGAPDGMKIDRQGNVFTSGPGGIWVLDPGGKVLGLIHIRPLASNCAFGDDEKTLFVTADYQVVRVNLFP